MALAVIDTMVAAGYLELTSDAGLLTYTGVALLRRLGVDFDIITARRVRIGGPFSVAPLFEHCLAKGWVRHADGTRAVTITPKGQRGFREPVGVSLKGMAPLRPATPERTLVEHCQGRIV